MGFNAILNSWKASVAILQWKNLKLLLLVTFKSVQTTFFTSIKYFWWLYAFTLVFLYFFSEAKGAAGLLLALLVFALFSFLLLLIIRPSVERKDIHYFYRYANRIFGVFFVAYISCVTVVLLSVIVSGFISLFVPFFKGVLRPFLFFAKPFFVTSSLFFLDSKGGVKDLFFALWRGGIGMVYHMPVYTVIALLLFALESFILGGLAGRGAFLVWYFMTIFFYALVTNYYLKMKHGNFKLFYGHN